MLVIRESSNTSNISNSLEFVKFLHPRTNQLVYYAICKEKNNQNIFELQSSISRKHGSWFINHHIIGNSKIVCLSVIDPKFLLLPYLLTSEKYCPIDQLISATYKEGCDRLPIEWINKWNMIDICDINDKLGDDMILYRLNKIKLENFLRKKVFQLAYCIMKRRTGNDLPLPSTSSTNVNISKVINKENIDQDEDETKVMNISNSDHNRVSGGSSSDLISKEDVQIALQIITDYLPTKVTNEIFVESFLKESLSETANGCNGKRNRDWEESLLIEKDKVAGVGLVNYDNTKNMMSNHNPSNKKSTLNNAKKAITSTTTKKIVKNDGTNKNIMSFFAMKKI